MEVLRGSGDIDDEHVGVLLEMAADVLHHEPLPLLICDLPSPTHSHSRVKGLGVQGFRVQGQRDYFQNIPLDWK